MKTLIACLGCKAQVEVEVSNSGVIRELARASGFVPLIKIDTTWGWLCPGCLERIVPHVAALCGIFGSESDKIHWSGLKYLLKKM
jgi:hypothetical protein